MKKTLLIIALLVSALSLNAAEEDEKKFTVELEAGLVGQTYNDIQIPNNDAGTRFALDDVVGSGTFNAFRIGFTSRLTANTELQFVYAPFEIEESGELASNVFYNGAEFSAGSVDAVYKFNTYRLSYRYYFHNSDRWKVGVGFTGLVRDADVAFKQGSTEENYDNLGFVPLLDFVAQYKLAEDLLFKFDFNGLAGGPGRLLEGDARLQWQISDTLYLGAGFRVLEGGADVDDVYNFAMLYTSYVTAGVRF